MHRATSSSNQLAGHLTFERDRVEVPQQYPRSRLARTMESLGRLPQPSELHVAATGARERSTDGIGGDDRAEIGECPRQARGLDAVDPDEITRFERVDVVGDRAGPLPSMCSVDGQLDRGARANPSRPWRRAALRWDAAAHPPPASTAAETACSPRGRAGPKPEHRRRYLLQPPGADRGGDAPARDSELGGLASGEHAVLRGRELRNSAEGVVGHVTDRTEGV